MNSYDERLQREALARKQEQQKVEEWMRVDLENQVQQKLKQFYPTNLDGVPVVVAADGNHLTEGENVLVIDGYGEVTVLNNLYFDAFGAIDGKRLKYTVPLLDETPFMYFVDGKTYYFQVKLSKNQVILADGELYTVLNIDKETKEAEVEKKETRKLQTMYPVYQRNQGGEKQAIAYYEKWGDAYGTVLSKRFSGEKNYSL